MKKNFKFQCERFIMNLPQEDILKVEAMARKNGVTMSWLYRAVLFALFNKFSASVSELKYIRRPLKFSKEYRKITICMYGDKKKWMTLSGIWQVELGPLIRYGLDLLFSGNLVLDLDSVQSIKEGKNHKIGNLVIAKKNNKGFRYIYHFQNEADLYPPSSFRPKNPAKNLLLMEMGIQNRRL